MYKSTFKNLITLAAGGILPLAFTPFGYYPIAIISPLILFWLWLKSSAKLAAWYGFLFGLGFFGIGVSWVYISIHTYGNTSVLLAGFITALFIMYLSLFFAMQGWVSNYFFPKNNALKLLVVFPLTWVLCECLRGLLFTGFPWLILGYSQIDSPLKNLAPILGVSSISLALTFTAGALLYTLRNKSKMVFCSLVVLWLGAILLGKISWVNPNDKTIQVTLVQGNIPQEIKWQASALPQILNTYTQLTNAHWDSTIIVWPEAAIPNAQNQVPKFLHQLSTTALQHHSTIITGIPIATRQKIYNGIITLGQNHNLYLKRHLVPFGEYLPLKNIFGNLLKFFSIPMSDLSAGKNQPPLIINGITIAPFICYEIIYPELVFAYLPKTQLLLTISDDSWFGKSFAAAQHLAMARMRSLETGRYQLMTTNTGITAFIDYRGEIITQAPTFKATTLTSKIQLIKELTPYSKLRLLFR